MRRRVVFPLTVLAAAALSTGAYALVLSLGGSPQVATLFRLAVSAPIVFLGLRAFHDPLRIGLAIATSTGAKLALEPLLGAVLLLHAPAAAPFAPLLGDLGYGPFILFAMLRGRHREWTPA
jgi:hypothetical protein